VIRISIVPPTVVSWSIKAGMDLGAVWGLFGGCLGVDVGLVGLVRR